MASQGQSFIKRNRPPRVHITYEDPYDANRLVELPFVMGVMSDLSGNASEVDKPPLDQRDFLEIDMDNFDKRMAAIRPAVALQVDNKLDPEKGEKMSVKIEFEKMDDFTPAAIARNIPATAKLLEARNQLANLMSYMDGKQSANEKLKELLKDPALMAALKERASAAAIEPPPGAAEGEPEDKTS
jgi:type VI secretion system protein ImpB